MSKMDGYFTLSGLLEEYEKKKKKHHDEDDDRHEKSHEKAKKDRDRDRRDRDRERNRERDRDRRRRERDDEDEDEEDIWEDLTTKGVSGIYEVVGRKDTLYLLKDRDYDFPVMLFSGRRFKDKTAKIRKVEIPRRLFVAIAKHMKALNEEDDD